MKKFWLISAMVAALSLAACSSDTASEEETDTGAETEEAEESSDSAEENESEESTEETADETELYVVGDEVEVNGAMMTVTGAQVVEELEEANRVYEVSFTVTNDSEEDLMITSEDFMLMDLSDEEKEAHGDAAEVEVPAGETAEGNLQYVASASTAFKLIGTFEDTEVEWRLPGITALD